jgi:hypothetical protein
MQASRGKSNATRQISISTHTRKILSGRIVKDPERSFRPFRERVMAPFPKQD